MKKLVVLQILFLFLTCNLYSQGYTLQFNQVLLVNNVQAAVPTGKVWKVESVMPQTGLIRTTATNSYAVPLPGQTADFVIIVNGNNVFVGEITTGVTSGSISAPDASSAVYSGVNTGLFPMWLPAGTTLQASTNIRYISVIEFNVVL